MQQKVRGIAIKHFSENISSISWECINFKTDRTNLSDGRVDLNNLLYIDDELKKFHQGECSYDNFIELCKKLGVWETEKTFSKAIKEPDTPRGLPFIRSIS